MSDERPLFPRELAGFASPREAMASLRWEKKLQHDAELAERVWAERERVKRAFLEGMQAVMSGATLMLDGPEHAWLLSHARRDLYPGPPTPLHLRAALLRAGHRICDCRRPGGPGEGM